MLLKTQIAIAAVLTFVANGMVAQPTVATVATVEKPETELRRITQELLDAIAPGYAEVWARYLDERMVHVDENGIVRGKAELLKELTPLPSGLVGHIAIDSFKVVLHGNVAIVAHEDQEHLDYFGQILRSRFRSSDTWLKTSAGWRLIGEQTSVVLRDPPVIALTHEQLCAYAGSYMLTIAITGTVRCDDSSLVFERANRPIAQYVSELPDVFFVKGQPRTRRIFLRDANGKLIGFVDRREGEDIRWTKIS